MVRTWNWCSSVEVLFWEREMPYKKIRKQNNVLDFYLSGKSMLSSDTFSGPQTEIWKHSQLFTFSQFCEDAGSSEHKHVSQSQEDGSSRSDKGQRTPTPLMTGSALGCTSECIHQKTAHVSFNTRGDWLLKKYIELKGRKMHVLYLYGILFTRSVLTFSGTLEIFLNFLLALSRKREGEELIKNRKHSLERKPHYFLQK